ncbi:MAG: hypothetical protein ACLFR1_08815 [Spirochaetia bacterium]
MITKRINRFLSLKEIILLSLLLIPVTGYTQEAFTLEVSAETGIETPFLLGGQVLSAMESVEAPDREVYPSPAIGASGGLRLSIPVSRFRVHTGVTAFGIGSGFSVYAKTNQDSESSFAFSRSFRAQYVGVPIGISAAADFAAGELLFRAEAAGLVHVYPVKLIEKYGTSDAETTQYSDDSLYPYSAVFSAGIGYGIPAAGGQVYTLLSISASPVPSSSDIGGFPFSAGLCIGYNYSFGE